MICSCVVPFKRVLLQIIFCSIGTTLSREKWQIASLSGQGVIKIWKQTWRSDDKTIIELGYRKISWFVSVSQINYLASANNWSARLWQITIFCSTSPPITIYSCAFDLTATTIQGPYNVTFSRLERGAFVLSLQGHSLRQQGKKFTMFLSSFSINRPTFYHECRSPNGYTTHYLFNN